MDNQEFYRENLEELIAALGITMETRTCKLLHKPMVWQPEQIIAVNWMAGKVNRMAKGSLFANNCGTRRVRPCCTLDILFAALTIIRL